MHIAHRGLVFHGEKGTDHPSCAFPGICVLPSGRWLCTCRAAPTKPATAGQHVLLSWSDDEGQSWTKPVAPFVPPDVAGQPGLFRVASLTALGGERVLAALCWVERCDPSLPYFNEKTQGLLDTKVFLAESREAGESWSKPMLVNTHPFHVPAPLTGPVLLLRDGRWACHFELNKHYDDTAVWRHSSVCLFSSDEGKTWPEHVVVSHDPTNRIFYWDQRPAVLQDGTILDVFWTYDNQAAVYLNIHARESRDNGKTWSEIWDAGIPGQPAPPVAVNGGRIALVYVDRTASPVIKLRLSSDRGRTWPAHTEQIVHGGEVKSQTWRKQTMQDAWAEMGKFSIGLPCTALLPDGDVLVAYYAGPETDCTDIHWARVRIG